MDLVGATSIFKPTREGFTIFIRSPTEKDLLVETTETNKWHINWVGIEDLGASIV